MRRLWPIAFLALSACSFSSSPRGAAGCMSDDQCGEGQLCFAEGCGDPGSGIVVEVEGNALSGHLARDVAITSGSLGASQNFDLGSPLSISGEFQRERSTVPDPTNRTFYADPVAVTAVGQSRLLPGIKRVYEARYASTERGAFQMRLGAGEYALTAMPGDRTVPPAVIKVNVEPAATSPLATFVFPAADGAPALTGQLIRRLDMSTVPPEPVLLSTAFTITGTAVPQVDLQLFDVENNPLSQRFPIATTTGEFAITVSPEARLKERLIIVASPRDPGVPIPTKRFVIEGPLSTATTLEYGEFGEAAEVTGTLVDGTGAPVAGAQVQLEGTVVGDGTFRSRVVETDARGEFRVTSLASKSENSFALNVAPPKGSRAASARRPVTVRVSRTASGLVATLTPPVLTLEDRIVARGLVLRPDGKQAAPGVFVRAIRQEEAAVPGVGENQALPTEPADTITDGDGQFELPLDPGVWRFEYTPGEALPLSSRLVTIRPVIDELTQRRVPVQDLTPVQLSFGRTVAGVVTGNMGALMNQPVPYSRLRFFRVTTVEGRAASILLGTTVADERGRYEVVLPTVSSGEK